MLPRQLLVQGLRRAGIDVHRRPPVLIRTAHELAPRPEFVLSHLAARRGADVTVLQIGAFDGQDAVAFAMEHFGWTAVLVEPQAGPFSRLQQRYAQNPRVQLYNVAVSETNGSRILFTVDEAADVPEWVRGTASFQEGHIERACAPRDVRAHVRRTEVQTLTFDTLLERAGVTPDVLFIDAEGYDYQLLKMFDVSRRLPDVVVFEHGHLSRMDIASACAMLAENGYQMTMTHDYSADTVAYRRDEQRR